MGCAEGREEEKARDNMKIFIIVLLSCVLGCSMQSVAEQNAQIIAHAKACTDAGLDFTIGTNGLDGTRDAYCIKKELAKDGAKK